MNEISALEAKNTLSALLDLVEAGEEIVITRHGKPVARLVPPHRAFSREQARAAAAAIRKLSEGATLSGVSIEDLINEGRLSRLAPETGTRKLDAARAAAARLRARATQSQRGKPITQDEWKAFREEGRGEPYRRQLRRPRLGAWRRKHARNRSAVPG